MRFLKQNTATRITVGPFLDKTDGITPETGLTATNEHLTFMVDTGGVPTLVIDANLTGSGGDNDFVHVTNDDAGFYDLELTATQTNYVGRAMLSINYVTDHCPVFHEFTLLPANVYDSLVGSDYLQTDIAQLLGTAWLTPATAGTPDVNLISAPNSTAMNAIADALLNRDMATGSDTNLRSVRNALRRLRNKCAVVTGSMTVYKENDSTEAWSATVTSDAGANPITAITPDE